MQVADLEIDLATRTVRPTGQIITRISQEVALLELLSRNREIVVSRSAVWQHLDEKQHDYTSNITHILHTQKTGRGFDPPGILRRWDQDYLLRSDEDS